MASSKSVQGRNNGDTTRLEFPGGPVNPFTWLTINLAGVKSDGIPVWSYYPQVRDSWLRLLSKQEPIMSGALYSVTSRVKSLRWDVTGGRNQKKYYQELFAQADGGAGWSTFVSKIVYDLCTQDNGAFIELVGAGRPEKPLKGRVTALWHLDAAQCWRTFDPEYPVIYTNPLDNTYHRMHKSRVILLSSNPQPDERARNIGFCAVSRAFKLMQIMRNIETYKDEKISGRFKRGLIYGSGFTQKQFTEATERSEQISENLNFTIFNEIPVLLSMLPDTKLEMLNLAQLPDGFNYEQEVTLYVYVLALCLGVDAREFWPATASGATKADATVQHLKAQGKFIADVITAIEHALNWQIMPDGGTKFEFDYTDDEQDKAVAELQKVKAENIAFYQQNGWINPLQAQALAIKEGLIDPAALLAVQDSEVADDSAPMDEEDFTDPQSLEPQAGQIDQFEFDPTATGGKAVPTKFEEQKHERDKSGKFGSGGGSSTPTSANGTTPAATAENVSPEATSANLTPLAARLQAFLGILNQAGSYKDGVLTIKRSTRDRSADLQKYLRNKGYPNATVSAQRTGKGYVYTINTGGQADAPKKRRRRKKGEIAAVRKDMKALMLNKRLAKYQSDLEDLLDDYIKKVGDSPSVTTVDKHLKVLTNAFADQLETNLTTAFGLGLAGRDPSKKGIKKLKTVAQESYDYFVNSFVPDLRAATLEPEPVMAGGAAIATKDLTSFISRIRMYGGAFWESIWQGLGDRVASEKSLKVKRVLDPAASHCKTCPAKEKVYNSYNDMVAVAGIPGDGSDDCLTNCRCTLEVETEPGSESFESLVGSPTVFVTPLFEVLR